MIKVKLADYVAKYLLDNNLNELLDCDKSPPIIACTMNLRHNNIDILKEYDITVLFNRFMVNDSKFTLNNNSMLIQLVLDNYKIKQVENISQLLSESNVISYHVHVTDETKNMVNSTWLKEMKPNVLLVNTSRGDIIIENDLVEFLSSNNQAKIATDVLAEEIQNRKKSPLLKYAGESNQVIITPHIGGMTREAQEIAYNHAATLLDEYFKDRNNVYTKSYN